jgi:hypothetical protein
VGEYGSENHSLKRFADDLGNFTTKSAENTKVRLLVFFAFSALFVVKFPCKAYLLKCEIQVTSFVYALRLTFFAARARFFCFGFCLVLPEVPREIFPRFER